MWGQTDPWTQREGVVEEGAPTEEQGDVAALLRAPGLWMPRAGPTFPLAVLTQGAGCSLNHHKAFSPHCGDTFIVSIQTVQIQKACV